MIHAHRFASRPCAWPNPDQAIQIGPGSVLHNMTHAFTGKKTELKRLREVGSGIYDSGCTLAVRAITGSNQNASGSDPACLLGIASDHPLVVLIIMCMSVYSFVCLSARPCTNCRVCPLVHSSVFQLQGKSVCPCPPSVR